MADDPRLAEARIPTFVLTGLLEIADVHGLVTDSWFTGTGLTRDQLTQTDSKVSFRQAAAFLRRGLDALPPGPHGMRIGSRDILVSWGVLGLAIQSCRTVGEAVAVGTQLHQAAGSLLNFEVETFGSEFALHLTERAPEPDILPFVSEDALCSTLLLIQTLVDQRLAPTRVEFAYPEPGHVAEYRRFFRCPLQFGADATRMYLPLSTLAMAIPTHNPTHLTAALEASRRLIDPNDVRPDTVAAVEAVLRDNMHAPLTMAGVAERLLLSERSLRRRLASTGHSFHEIRDRVRNQRATLLLRQTSRSMNSIAAEIGFSDAREFRRAFLRWNGRTPSSERHS